MNYVFDAPWALVIHGERISCHLNNISLYFFVEANDCIRIIYC